MSDLEDCLAVARSVGADATALEQYLNSLTSPFFVLVHDGRVVACGGYGVEAGVAWLRWGMVRRDAQGQGVGRFLLLYRLREIGRTAPMVEFVKAQVQEPLAAFFERQGFRLETVGTMAKRLKVCA
jgi:GNAT superfamily N-acetyltransferase